MEYTFYGIKDQIGNIIYVGKSYDFKERQRIHKKNFYDINCSHYHYKIYKYIRQNGGFDKFSFKVLETKLCDKPESKLIESNWIKIFNPICNQFVPFYTDIDGDKDNIKEWQKEYRDLNRDKIYEKNKQYRDLNRDKIYEKNKNYRDLNRDKIYEKKKEKFECECGIITCINHKQRHYKSKNHIDYINSLKNIFKN
jgi:hypothetical protein